MKKHSLFLIIFLISTFLIFTPNVKASFGDLRYEVTEVNISGTNIRFKGWAFIHKTNNFTTIYKNGNLNDGVLISGGGQQINITAHTLDGKTIESRTISGQSSPNYNFYRQQFYQFANNIDYKAYYNKGYNDNANTCLPEDENKSSQCYYQDMAFDISFNINSNSWSNIADNSEIYFTISVTNEFYKNKMNNENAWVTEKLYIGENIVKEINGNDYIEIDRSSVSNTVEFIAITARPMNINNDGLYNGIDFTYGETGKIYKLGETYKKPELIQVLDVNTYTPGKFSIYIRPTQQYCDDGYYCWKSTCNNDGSYCETSENVSQASVWTSWVKPIGETSFRIKIKRDKKCPIVNPSSGPLTCNNDKTLTATCDELTVTNNGSRANVKISQTGTISSILTPNEIYAGGGFSLGLIYYNTISWSCISGNCDNNITSAMQSRLQNDFQNSIKLENITFNGKSIDSSLFVKKCQETGSFTNGNTLTTVCTFFLPKSTISPYNGKITYGTGEDLGINNKYYTLLTDNGEYEIKLKITGMDRLSASSTREDSVTRGTSWTGDWSKELTGCSINVYPLLEKPTGTTPSQNMQFNFLYRPIDLNNPFPSRNAGVNWFDWYSVDKNKERLKSSYNRLQYSININNQTISKIKNYNKGKNYLEWDNFENGKSGFVSEYFNIKRQNIVGDE